ncbi:MAG: Gfo/Idh/MocA family oxidoreductase [Planctomycetia bacterium]|nr:Gfo/Idh/MocA family oxidoreductase [Planctomycetia bacterium]
MSTSARKSKISRRDFTKSAAASAAGAIAAALAGPVILSRSSLSQDKAAASDRLTLGFIGVGTMNRGHLGHFLNQKDAQVLAVCDVDTTRREAAKKTVEDHYAQDKKDGKYQGCAAYNDCAELIARSDIDAVVIATPDHWHTAICIEACKAKKDIYCEKPLTLTIHEAKTLIDAVRKHERVFQTGSQQRSSNEFRLACELVRSGRIGKLKTIQVKVGPTSKPCDLPEEEMEKGLDWDRWLGPAPKRPYNSVLSPRGVHKHFPAWRDYREYSGGMMTDWGAHHYDIAQWGLGMDESGPVEIIPPQDEKAEYGVRHVYTNGVEVVHMEGNDVVFIGTDGEITVNRGKLQSKPEGIVKEPLSDKDVHLYKSPGHQRDWMNCIHSRQRPICDVEIGARSVTVCHLGNLAYWNHRKLKWDPAKWQFVDDSEANRWLNRERRSPYGLPKA